MVRFGLSYGGLVHFQLDKVKDRDTYHQGTMNWSEAQEFAFMILRQAEKAMEESRRGLRECSDIAFRLAMIQEDLIHEMRLARGAWWASGRREL